MTRDLSNLSAYLVELVYGLPKLRCPQGEIHSTEDQANDEPRHNLVLELLLRLVAHGSPAGICLTWLCPHNSRGSCISDVDPTVSGAVRLPTAHHSILGATFRQLTFIRDVLLFDLRGRSG